MPKPPSAIAERARVLFASKAENDERLGALRRPGAVASADEFLAALVEGAFLVAAADGELDPDEASTLAETITHITGSPLGPEEFMALIDRFAAARARDGLRARFAAIASSLPDEAARREVVAFAALVALCDNRLAPAERAMLAEIARAAGLATGASDAIINETQGALGGGA
ncbi:MAG TPA: tellurite resistance TerB family protein [Polyangiaceae bacterium]|nr:tellurite resistance TerB family protein [Polyangiaceae bacterium]